MKLVVTVPLKKVCAQANVNPRVARRILRSKRKRLSGRWAWPASKIPSIIELLKREVPNGKA